MSGDDPRGKRGLTGRPYPARGEGGPDNAVRCAAAVVSGVMTAQPIRIIGIDPGLRRTGWGIVEADGSRLGYVASGIVTSDDARELAYRLRELYEGLSAVIATFAPREALKVTGEENLSTYTFNTHTIRHRFCAACGTATFGEGQQPGGEPMAAINVRCLDTVELSDVKPVPFNGRDR